MRTPQTTFRLEKEVLEAMDRLVKFPPSSLLDKTEGRPRSRAELVRFLVLREAKAAERKRKK